MSNAVAALSWLAVVAVLAAYGWRHGCLFDKANVLCFKPIALPANVARAYSSAAISVAFGLIAVWKLTHPITDERRHVRTNTRRATLGRARPRRKGRACDRPQPRHSPPPPGGPRCPGHGSRRRDCSGANDGRAMSWSTSKSPRMSRLPANWRHLRRLVL